MSVQQDVAAETTAAPPVEQQPKSFREVLGARFDELDNSQVAAEESAATADPAVEEAQSAQPADSAAPPEPEKPAEVPERVVVAVDQLKSPKYWDSLDASGWERMQRDYPVETANVKASKAAAVKKYNEIRDEARATETQRHDAQSDEPSPELMAAVEQSQSLDPKEAVKGHILIAKLTAATVAQEVGINPSKSKADAVLADAYTDAVQKQPDLKTFLANDEDRAALDKIADESEELTALIETGTAKNIAIAMAGAARVLGERKRAATASADAVARQAKIDEKKRETAKIVQSSARPASADVLAPHGAPPTEKLPLRKRLSESKAWEGSDFH